jgi:acetone carboxylase gamma subunit
MARARVSPTLTSEHGQICCARCDSAIASGKESWKEHASMTEVRAAELPGAGLSVEPNVVVRRFCCRSCGALLDSETALPGDPFLQDFVAV